MKIWPSVPSASGDSKRWLWLFTKW